jgi:hypothetical protein
MKCSRIGFVLAKLQMTAGETTLKRVAARIWKRLMGMPLAMYLSLTSFTLIVLMRWC